MNVFNDGQVSEREKIERNEHQKQLDRELEREKIQLRREELMISQQKM